MLRSLTEPITIVMDNASYPGRTANHRKSSATKKEIVEFAAGYWITLKPEDTLKQYREIIEANKEVKSHID